MEVDHDEVFRSGFLRVVLLEFEVAGEDAEEAAGAALRAEEHGGIGLSASFRELFEEEVGASAGVEGIGLPSRVIFGIERMFGGSDGSCVLFGEELSFCQVAPDFFGGGARVVVFGEDAKGLDGELVVARIE